MTKKRKNPDDAPEIGREFFARAERVADMSELAEAVRRLRGKQKALTKVAISIRVDRPTVDAFRSTGKGWQGRMNDALGRAAKRLRAS